MNVNVTIIPAEKSVYKNKTVVMLDILRASSTIVTALNAGCRSVRTCETVEEAREIKKDNPHILLCGERGGLKPEGFDLDNSPLTYTAERVSGKEILLTTSNGTRAVAAAAGAANLLIGCFLNLDDLLSKALSARNDIVFLCAGTDGSFSYEDALCAGLAIHEINKRVCDISLEDGARWAYYALKGLLASSTEISRDQLKTLLANTMHGSRLISLGFEKDIDYCSVLNSIAITPVLTQGKLII